MSFRLRNLTVLMLFASLFVRAAEQPAAPSGEWQPKLAPASDEAELFKNKFKLPEGFVCDLFAAEPMLAHPVAFCIDNQNRFYVCELFRFADGINGGGERDYGAMDMRGHMEILDQDLASRSTADREAMIKRRLGEKVSRLTLHHDRIRLIEDKDGDGKADNAVVFADGFNRIVDGAGAGVIARKGTVWYTCIPDLVQLKDTNGDGKADQRKTLLSGFGVRIAFLGHDLHGLCFGPDGKLYFSVGDRGFAVTSQEGKSFTHPEYGATFRCNPDGSEFEVFAIGQRNPQELTFDNYGNLYTADNNADMGDGARWVYIVEGGDSGWRGGYQYIRWPNNLGPWNSEKLWKPQFDGQAAYIVPPVANVGAGPSGVNFYPGTGLSDAYNDTFFYCDYRGEGGGVFQFKLKPKGASYELIEQKNFFWSAQATDIEWGPDGGAYVSLWVGGISKTGKGRIYRAYDPKTIKDPLVLETKKLLNEGFEKRAPAELVTLLAHKDKRVRQEAQFELADRGADSIPLLAQVAQKKESQFARLHAIWGLGQIGRKNPAAFDAVLPLLVDEDIEVRSNAARVLGDGKVAKAFDGLIKLLSDTSPRAKYFGAMGLGKLGRKDALQPLLEMIKANTPLDPMLRHAGMMALLGMNDKQLVESLSSDPSPAVRMVSLLAMRRLEMPQIARFLKDADPLLAIEAARAINDVPIADAMPQLAALIQWTSPEPPAYSTSEPFMLRVINANFRLGTPQHAAALAAYAARADAPGKGRAGALQLLASWPQPSQRDLIVGLYRPLQPRDEKVAADALRKTLPEILRSAPAEVRKAAFEAAEKFKIKEAAPVLFELVANEKLAPDTRVAALKALVAIGDVRVTEAVKIATADKNDALRNEGNKFKAQINPAGSVAALGEIVEKSTSVIERQGAMQTLGTIKDAKADEILLKWAEMLAAGGAPKELHLDIAEAAAKRTAEPIKSALEKISAQAASAKDDTLAGYRDTLFGGDAALGRKVFYEKAEAQCMRCHKIGSEGGEAGPALGDVGKKQTREYILESILQPNAKISVGFESLIVKMNDGKTHVGLMKKESDKEMDLLIPPDTLVKVQKAEIKSSKRGQSLMPEELNKVLSKQDIRNLVEFLATQTGGAEKGHGAH
ncbi:MAG TPA: PVC-type heme-binding CxxCH protein [Planctomycetota bacterium]|nr:PVC-type heme-binding CxxCH protein [Planctomycetota bacterium]